jgi:curved DNA-binding protein CbpA
MAAEAPLPPAAASHYAVLRLSPAATAEEVRAAYHARALACHPDKGGSAAAFQAVQRAWEALGSAQQRASYDAELAAGARATAVAVPVSEEVRVGELEAAPGGGGARRHACRCGEGFAVPLAQLQGGLGDLVNCSGCSLYIRLLWD